MERQCRRIVTAFFDQTAGGLRHFCFGPCRADFRAATGSAFAANPATDARRTTVSFPMVKASADKYPPEPADRIATTKLGGTPFPSSDRQTFSTVPSRARMTPDEKKVVSSSGCALCVE